MISRSTRVALLLAAASLTLAACATGPEPATAAKAVVLPTEQYPLEVAGHPDEIRLAAHASGLSLEQRAALARLANRWLDSGGGALTVQTPIKGADPRAASETSLQAMALLLSMGAPAERVRQVGYEPTAPDLANKGPAPVIVGFAAYEAVIPKCGTVWENLSANSKNKPMGNFGCAVSANMAAQIANPGDIAQPRADDPVDAGRRAFVLDKYRTGEATSGAKDAQSSGAVSKSSSSGGG